MHDQLRSWRERWGKLLDKMKGCGLGLKKQVNGGALFCEWRAAVPQASRHPPRRRQNIRRVPGVMLLPYMESSMTQPWDAALQRLLLEGVLSGFSLLDHRGESMASYGALSDEPIVAQQLQSLFQTGAAKCSNRAALVLRRRHAATALLPPPSRPAAATLPAPAFPCSFDTRASRHLRPTSHHHTEIRQQRICRCAGNACSSSDLSRNCAACVTVPCRTVPSCSQ